jgi:branched-chain amino acid transport system permease protein
LREVKELMLKKEDENTPGRMTDLLEFKKHLPKERILLDLAFIAASFVLLAPILNVQRVTDFMIFCIFVLSFDLLYGYMGRLSFGHMLFLGAGAYGGGLCIRYMTKDPLLAVLAGIIMAGLLAMLLGIIIVRTTGACFALINLAFNQVGFFLVLSVLRDITKGEDGIGVVPAGLGWLNLGSRPVMFGFVLFFLLLVFYILRRVTTSPYGILIRSIKEDEARVKFLGYNTFLYKWLTYVFAGCVAGLAGTLSALNYGYVNPNFMDTHRNVDVIFAVLIGGAGNLYGAIIGGVVYMVISNYLAIYIPRWEMFLGISLLILVFRFRQGIWGFVREQGSRRSVRGEIGVKKG